MSVLRLQEWSKLTQSIFFPCTGTNSTNCKADCKLANVCSHLRDWTWRKKMYILDSDRPTASVTWRPSIWLVTWTVTHFGGFITGMFLFNHTTRHELKHVTSNDCTTHGEHHSLSLRHWDASKNKPPRPSGSPGMWTNQREDENQKAAVSDRRSDDNPDCVPHWHQHLSETLQ